MDENSFSQRMEKSLFDKILQKTSAFPLVPGGWGIMPKNSYTTTEQTIKKFWPREQTTCGHCLTACPPALDVLIINSSRVQKDE